MSVNISDSCSLCCSSVSTAVCECNVCNSAYDVVPNLSQHIIVT